MLNKHSLFNVGINQVMKAKTVSPFKKTMLHAIERWFTPFIILACKKVIRTECAGVTAATRHI